MKGSFGRSVRALLACAIALLAGGILVRQQAACQGCQPGNFTYDNPVGCDASCHVIYSGKLTGTCNSNCEASVLRGSCVGTKGSCTFHRDWVDKSCGGPPAPPPAPTNTTASIPTNTDTPQPPPAPTGTAEASSSSAPTSTALPAPTSTPAPTDTGMPSATSIPVPTDTALPSPNSTPPPADTPLPSPTSTDTPQPAPTSTNTPVPTPTPRPPELTSEVSCSVPGDGGWCRGGATLHLQASDPQGLGVVIHCDLNGNPFQCGPTCVLDLPEGQGTASFTAVSDSGRTASGSASWKLDSAPPELAAQLQGGTEGKNGWYTSAPVNLACTASDATSGVASIEYRLDGGAWGSAASATADGMHALECRARDNAGNMSQAGAQANIDSGSPTTSIVLPDGVWLAGHTTVRGSTKDAVSGLADVQVTLDGGSSWTSLGSGGNWEYGWDTRTVSDGGHSFSARGEDNAGNLESPQVVNVRVDNTPPVVSLAPSWRLSEGGKFTAEDSGSGIGSVCVVFSGNGIQPRTLTFSAPSPEITWDGIDGSGAHVGYGTYLASVTVCDLLGNCASAQGQVLNPAPPPPKPTWPRPTRTPTSTPTPTPTLTPRPSQSPRPVASQTSRPAPSVGAGIPAPVRPVPLPAEEPRPWVIWPFIGLLGLVAGVGSTFAIDQRAGEWRAMRAHLRTLFESQPGAEADPGQGGKK